MASSIQQIVEFGDRSALLPTTCPGISGSKGQLYEFPIPASRIESEGVELREGAGCARGIRLALAFEGALGIGIYLVWNFWHLVR